MAKAAEIISDAILIGIGATALIDLWAAFLRRCFGVSSLDFALLGRWIGHFPRGQFVHHNIRKAAPVRNERIIGWSAHYGIGVLFRGGGGGRVGAGIGTAPHFSPRPDRQFLDARRPALHASTRDGG